MTEFTTHKTCHEEKLLLISEIKNTYFLSINWPWIFCRKETNKDLIRYGTVLVINNIVNVIRALLSLARCKYFLVGLVSAGVGGSRQDLDSLSKITKISARSFDTITCCSLIMGLKLFDTSLILSFQCTIVIIMMQNME